MKEDNGVYMRIDEMSDADSIMHEISRRFKQYRILYPMTQADLADKSMVSLSTIKRFENGEDIGFSKLIRLLKTLGLHGHLEVLIADQSIRPSAFLPVSRPRQRARKKAVRRTGCKWGDER